MHHELTKALYDVLPLEDKNDFFPAYIYLKYIERFIHQSFEMAGLPIEKPAEKVGEDVDEMLKYYLQQIGEASASTETNTYHGKVVQLRDAIKLITQKQDLNITLPERVLPFKLARDVVLKSDGSIAAGTCVCRSIAGSPCLSPPREICLFVGDPYASFIAAENPLFRKVSQKEAVEILEFAHEQRFVHTAYFKKEMANRFMAICNCCSCCCMGVRMWNALEGAIPIMAPSGYVCEVGDGCDGCGICAEDVCNFNAIAMDEAENKAVINLDKCMGCGVCEDVCPLDVISLRREPSKGDPLDLEELKILAT